MAQNYKHLFGPVHSRRLGLSLGVDLLPFKTCSLDCVYCECGRTTCKTDNPKPFISTKEVTNELNEFLAANSQIDYVTFSGAGEPTLASNLGEIIDYLKDNFPQFKICVLTNGTLFQDPAVRKMVLRADIVSPTLNAVTSETFLKINRPVRELRVNRIINGLIDLRQEFKNQLWLEVFIIPGLNDNIEELQKMKEVITEIAPDKIQLNSLDRPGTESWVKPASREELDKIVALFKPLPVEIIARHSPLSQDFPRQAQHK